jgi:16S rRNA (cytosine1402-N4)-methyltransferase
MENPGGTSIPHRSVLYHEIIHALRPKSPGRYIDATVGAGGHAFGILEASTPQGRLLGIDLDPQALALAGERLKPFTGRVTLVEGSYTTLADEMRRLGWQAVDGIVMDLGVSSMQIDTAGRGFSFMADGPLDMRFGPTQPLTAEDIVNGWEERELAEIFWRYGEEQQSRRIARAIIQARPLYTTHQLADVVARAAGRGTAKKGAQRSRIHPATRTFQALRITVNQELQAVETALPLAVEALAPGGRLAVISFHSLEDRIVKQFFRRESRDCICPPEQPVCTCSHRAQIVEINRRPVEAAEEEVEANPRARSARLRVAERLSPV